MMNFFSVNNALKEYAYMRQQQVTRTLLIHVMNMLDVFKFIDVIKK